MATKKRIGLVDIQRRFDTEDACRDYLFKHRWPDGFICERLFQIKSTMLPSF